MKKTNQEIINFLEAASPWLEDKESQTKFKYALSRVQKFAEKAYKDMQEKISDISIENAATDEKDVILTDEKGNFRYTKEGLKKRNKEQREVLKETVEIDNYHATEVPENLSESDKEAFAGFVLKEENN